MKFPPFIVIAGLSVGISELGAQETEVLSYNETRPLSWLVGTLNYKHRYLISYEEAPYLPSDLRVRRLPDGRGFRYPVYKAMDVSIRFKSNLVEGEETSFVRRPISTASELADQLVRNYNASGNPGRFVHFDEGGRSRIVQIAQVSHGKVRPITPLLDSKIQMKPGPQPCRFALSEWMGHLTRIGGVGMAEGVLPLNPLLTRTCTITGEDLTARQVLMQILEQLGTGSDGTVTTLFAYALLHDADSNKFWLSTQGVAAREVAQPAARILPD